MSTTSTSSASCGRRGCARLRRTRRSSRSTPPRAKARDGVVAVYTNEDLDMEAGLPMAWVPPGVTVNTPDHWVLAKGEVKHVGDPVALVIGDDRYAVVDAAEDVVVEYDPLPVVTDPEKALGPVRHSSTSSSGRTRCATGRWGRRSRGRVCRGRRDHRAPRRQPSHRRGPRSSHAPCWPSIAAIG